MKQLRVFYLLILAAVVFSANIFAQTTLDLSQELPIDENVRIGKLDNGLVYYIKKNAKPEKRVELKLAVNAGSLYETDAQQGLAHFVEHMCFNGTKNFEKNELVDFLEKMGVRFGADLNAYTSFAETVYMLQLPTDKPELVDQGFQVIEDWAHNVTLADEEIDKERGVIKEEWRLGLGAQDRLRKKSFPVIFKGSRYENRIPIGTMEVIENFKYETIREFYKDWYRPNLMAVIVVGDIDVDQAEQKIKSHFAQIQNPANPKERVEYSVPDNKEPLISIATDKEATSSTSMIAYKHNHKITKTIGDYREVLLNTLYTQMLNNRFNEIAQRPDAPFIYAYSSYSNFMARSKDVFMLQATMKENMIEEGMKVMLAESERVKRFGFTETELERMKKEFISYYETAAKEYDKTQSKVFAQQYADHFLEQSPIPGIKNELNYAKELLPGITVEEINKLAQKWITKENIIVSIQAPEKEGLKIPTEKDVLNILNSAEAMNLTAYEDIVVDAPLLARMPKSVKVAKRVDNKEIGFTELTFENGIQVVLKETEFKNDEILFSAFSLGGQSQFSDNEFINAYLATTVINLSGVSEFDKIALDKKLAGQTVSLSPWMDEVREGLGGSSTPADFETLLKLNYLYFTAPRIDKQAFDAFISKTKSQLKFITSNPQFIFMDTLSKVKSSNSPRVMVAPTEDQLNNIDLERLFAMYKDRYADAGDFKFFIVGNFNTDAIIPMLETYIGGLPVTGRKETWKDVSPKFPEGVTEVIIKKGMDDKSMVTLTMEGDFEWTVKNNLELDILSEILSIKLRESMREEQGGVYTLQAYSSTEHFPKSTYEINVAFGCSPKNVKKLVNTIFVEMDKIKKDGPTDLDMEKIKETLIRERELALDKNGFWIGQLFSSYYHGTDINDLNKYNEMVNAVTAEDIRNAAAKYFTKDHYVKGILMPEKK